MNHDGECTEVAGTWAVTYGGRWELVHRKRKSKTHKEWGFRFRANNGRIVIPSQNYTRRIDAEKSMNLIRFNGEAPVIEVEE